METDREVMVRAAGQDETAFSVLVERYGGRLLAVARRLLGARADAEDAVQRALLQCYTAASSYQPQWAVSTWLYRILTNVCVDELRRRATRTAYGASYAVVDSARPREARVLLALRYAEGLSYGELAQIRGISVNTVKSQLARGKALLREELGKRGILHD